MMMIYKKISSEDFQGLTIITTKEVKKDQEIKNFVEREKEILMRKNLIETCKNTGKITMRKHVSFIGTRLIPSFHKLLIFF